VTVQQAIASCIAALPAIGKGDKSPEGYSYRGIEAITKHLQPILARYGVVISPHASITDVRPSPAMKDGWQDVYMVVDWTIWGPEGDSITARTTGIGRDRADKGANKAQTQAYKYLLLHLLGIADKNDDADGLTYEAGHAAERATKDDVDMLVGLFDALPEAERKVAKNEFARRFGLPTALPAHKLGEAHAWIMGRVEAPMPEGTPE
jgi:hypothetical protein